MFKSNVEKILRYGHKNSHVDYFLAFNFNGWTNLTNVTLSLTSKMD
jgi:hypothetical protein